MIRIALLTLALSGVSVAPAVAAKKPTPPTQSPIRQDCVVISGIASHRMGFVTPPGVEGILSSSCPAPVHVSLTVAYYDSKGIQFSTGYEFGTVAPQTQWKFYHVPVLDHDQRALRTAKIISVLVQPQ